MMKRISIILVWLLMLTSCSPVQVKPADRYLLNKIPCNVPVKRKSAKILMIPLPVTETVYSTTQMAYTLRPYQISYYSVNQWASTPEDMFEALLIQTMQNTHHFKAIVTPPYNGRYDYILNTEILELLQDYTCHIPVLKMTVRVQITRASNGRVIGTQQFSVARPLAQQSPYGGVFAANAAAAQILADIAAFTLALI